MKRTLRRITMGVVVVLGMISATAKADVVLDWNAIMLNTIAGQNPFAQARLAAITQTAVFEAVNAITGEYEPYLGTIIAPPGASPEAAAVAAAHGVLKNTFRAAQRISTWLVRLCSQRSPTAKPKTMALPLARPRLPRWSLTAPMMARQWPNSTCPRRPIQVSGKPRLVARPLAAFFCTGAT